MTCFRRLAFTCLLACFTGACAQSNSLSRTEVIPKDGKASNDGPSSSDISWKYDHSFFEDRIFSENGINAKSRYKHGLAHLQRVAVRNHSITISGRFSDSGSHDALPLLHRKDLAEGKVWDVIRVIPFSEHILDSVPPVLALAEDGRSFLVGTHDYPYDGVTINGTTIDTKNECILTQYLPHTSRRSGEPRSFWSFIFGIPGNGKIWCPFSDRSSFPNEVSERQSVFVDAWVPMPPSTGFAIDAPKLYVLSSTALGIYRGADYTDGSQTVGTPSSPTFYQDTTSWDWVDLPGGSPGTPTAISDMTVNGGTLLFVGSNMVHRYNMTTGQLDSQVISFAREHRPYIYAGEAYYHVVVGQQSYRAPKDQLFGVSPVVWKKYSLSGVMRGVCGISDNELYAINDGGQVFRFDGKAWKPGEIFTYEALNASRESSLAGSISAGPADGEQIFDTPDDAPTGPISLNAIACGDGTAPPTIVGNYGAIILKN